MVKSEQKAGIVIHCLTLNEIRYFKMSNFRFVENEQKPNRPIKYLENAKNTNKQSRLIISMEQDTKNTSSASFLNPLKL